MIEKALASWMGKMNAYRPSCMQKDSMQISGHVHIHMNVYILIFIFTQVNMHITRMELLMRYLSSLNRLDVYI